MLLVILYQDKSKNSLTEPFFQAMTLLLVSVTFSVLHFSNSDWT